MKSIESKYKYTKYIFNFLCFLSFSNLYILDVKSLDLKNENQITSDDFSSLFKGYSNMFEEDDVQSHIKKFFGLNPISETLEVNYTDLSIINDSKNLRELYDAKLNQMTTKISKDEEEVELFFKEKL